MTEDKRFHRVSADKWPIILAVLIFVAFAFAGCQQFLQQAPVAIISASTTTCAPGTEITFDGTSSYDPDGGSIASWSWDFGDGSTATGSTQTKSYSSTGEYTVTLTVTDDEGSTGTATVTINVTTAPTAIAKADPQEGEAPLTVNFDGSDSYDSNGSIEKFEWDFEGDGTFDCTTDDTSGCGTGGTDEKPVHTYDTQGVFTAVLRVTDDDGYTDSDTVSINSLGATIYFATDRDGDYEIFKMDTDGNNESQVTNNDIVDAFPALLYNTRLELAFASAQTAGADWDVFTSEVNGTLRANLTENQTASDQIEPSWNDEGSKIAYASDQTGDWDIWHMDADGTSKENLTSQTPYTEIAPAFSPDGTQIAYVSNEDGDYALWIMNSDGSSPENIYDSTGEDGARGPDLFGFGFGPSTPSWSPDGTKIAFTSDQDGNNEIYVIDSEGSWSNAKGITTACFLAGNNNFDPFWLPNGNEIAFVSNYGGGSYHIYKVDVSNLDNPDCDDSPLADTGNNITPANEPWNK